MGHLQQSILILYSAYKKSQLIITKKKLYTITPSNVFIYPKITLYALYLILTDRIRFNQNVILENFPLKFHYYIVRINNVRSCVCMAKFNKCRISLRVGWLKTNMSAIPASLINNKGDNNKRNTIKFWWTNFWNESKTGSIKNIQTGRMTQCTLEKRGQFRYFTSVFLEKYKTLWIAPEWQNAILVIG